MLELPTWTWRAFLHQRGGAFEAHRGSIVSDDTSAAVGQPHPQRHQQLSWSQLTV